MWNGWKTQQECENVLTPHGDIHEVIHGVGQGLGVVQLLKLSLSDQTVTPRKARKVSQWSAINTVISNLH